MTLEREVVERVIAHLRERWGAKPCPMCGGRKWVINGYVTLLMSDDPQSAPRTPHIGMPCASVICEVCGDTRLLNLAVAEIVGPDLRNESLSRREPSDG